MKRIGLSAALLCGVVCASFTAGAEQGMLLDDFEAGSQVWSYVGGQEFPGAKGSFVRDTAAAHCRGASCRLQGDFTGGPASGPKPHVYGVK